MNLILILSRRWHTIHEIAVAKEFQKQGVGRKLFDIVPMPVRLKTTADNKNAINFYEKKGMLLVNIEDGKKRKLCVFEKNDEKIVANI